MNKRSMQPQDTACVPVVEQAVAPQEAGVCATQGGYHIPRTATLVADVAYKSPLERPESQRKTNLLNYIQRLHNKVDAADEDGEVREPKNSMGQNKSTNARPMRSLTTRMKMMPIGSR